MYVLFILCALFTQCNAVNKNCESLSLHHTWKTGTSADLHEGNRIIKQNIQLGCIFMVYRIGGTEATCVSQRLYNPTSEMRVQAASESGVYPLRKDVYDTFIRLTIAAIQESTIFVDMAPLSWPSVNHIGNTIAQDAVRVTWYSLVSFWQGDGQNAPDVNHPSWVYSLENKTVLVVSMFHITGPKQYYRNDSRTPRFKELKWVTPPQSYGSSYHAKPVGWSDTNTWVNALEDLKRDVTNVGHFDIALLSCGSYGGPLQSHIKSLGASSMYLGGSLQALFGIKGNRWKDFLSTWVASHPEESTWWVNGDQKERPKYCDNVEGCPYHT